MNAVDWILILPLAYGAVKGGFNGLINEIASFLALVAGLWVAYRFSNPLLDILAGHMEINGPEIEVALFVLLFILTAAAVHLAGRSLTKAAKWAALGWLNRVVGAVFGLLKYAVITLVLVHLFERANSRFKLTEKEPLDRSFLYQGFLRAGDTLLPAWDRWPSGKELVQHGRNPR